jgi:CDP-paratose 2-epimerase
MEILVTGGAGFIGSHIAEFYASRRNDVTVIDNLSRSKLLKSRNFGRSFNWRYLKALPNVRVQKCDIRNEKELLSAATGSEAILHTAAQVAVTSSIDNPRIDFEVNAVGTFNVLEAARKNDSMIVFCSTNKVYGENVNRIEIKETDTRYAFGDRNYEKGIPVNFAIDLTGHSPYGCSKTAADLYVQDYAYTYGLKTGVFRMSCIYGERQFGVEDQGWVAWFVIATVLRKRLTIFGDGKQVRDVLYVGDLVRLFNDFLRSNMKHGVFNVGGGPDNTLSLLELMKIIEKYAGMVPKTSFREWRPADQKVYISDITGAHELLGWSPEVHPEVGVRRLIEWVVRNKEIWK